MSWALVTGASKGIGAATAARLAESGHDILVAYGHDAAGAESVADACRAYGVAARVVQADLATDPGPLVAAIDEVDGLSVLVNNAGVTADGLAMRMSDEDFQRPLQVNLAAAFTLCRAALRPMLRARAGRIVNVASVVGLHGNVGQANYAAAKAGLIGLTKSLAREVGRKGVTVNAVAPGFVDTAMTAGTADAAGIERIPVGRLGTPGEVAAVIAFLASPDAAYVNGAVIQVDGGLFA